VYICKPSPSYPIPLSVAHSTPPLTARTRLKQIATPADYPLHKHCCQGTGNCPVGLSGCNSRHVRPGGSPNITLFFGEHDCGSSDVSHVSYLQQRTVDEEQGLSSSPCRACCKL